MDFRLVCVLLAISALGVCRKAAPVLRSWIRARRSAAPIGFWRLWQMYFRNVPLEPVIDAYASARSADVSVNLAELASHARAGGDVRAVVHAYVETLRAGVRIEFARVCEIELDRDEEEAIGS